MQFAGTAKPPLGIVYDSNFGETIDSVLALAVLHGFAGKLQCRIASLSINYPDLRAAQLCDSIERFYASAITGPAAIFFTPSPIGIVEGKSQAAGDRPLLVKTVARTDEAGKKLWSTRLQKWNDTAIPELLIRNALSAQYDGNAGIVLSGPATNLASLLSLNGSAPLITSKVKYLVVAGGEFPSGKSEPNFKADLAAARKVLAEWPTPVIFSGREVGSQLPFRGASIETDFAYNAAHPIAEAYRSAHEMPYDAPGWALAAMLYAIRPEEGYFKLSEPGTVTLTNDGRTEFKPGADGRHRYLIADPAQQERISKIYAEMASAKPVMRGPRRPPQQQQNEEKPAEKPKAPESAPKPPESAPKQ